MKEILIWIKKSAIECYKNIKSISLAFLFLYFPTLLLLLIPFLKNKNITLIAGLGIVIMLVLIIANLIVYGFVGEWIRSILKNKKLPKFNTIPKFIVTGFLMFVISFIYLLVGYLPLLILMIITIIKKVNLFSGVPLSICWLAFFIYFSIGANLNFLETKSVKKGFAIKEISKRIFRLRFLIAFLIPIVFYIIYFALILLGLLKFQNTAQLIVGKAIIVYVKTFCLFFLVGILARAFKK